MKSKVLSPLHLLRRKLDSLLSSLFPPPTASQITSSLVFAPPGTPFPAGRVSRWSSLYHMTAFRADVGYAEAMRREKWQKSLVEGILWGLGGVGVVGVAAVGVMGWMGKGRSVWERLR
jgi:kynurenine 3-monooxygenase